MIRTMGARAQPYLVALVTGLLFAIGLGVSGMTQPVKIVGFLDIFGKWDPSLAFVMAGAVGVYLITYRGLVVKLSRPIHGQRFHLPTQTRIDRRLLLGAVIFGVGWGLSGLCPGPALVSLGAATGSSLWFVPGILAGMLLFQRLFPDSARGDG